MALYGLNLIVFLPPILFMLLLSSADFSFYRSKKILSGKLLECEMVWIQIRSDRTLVLLFDLILYVPSTNFQLIRDGSSGVGPVLS